MNKPSEYVTDLFRRLHEDISEIKHRLFTEKPKPESTNRPTEYSIDAGHVNQKSSEKTADPEFVVRARLNLPEAISVKAETEERPKPWRKDRHFIIQLAAVVVGGIVALIYFLQLIAMQGQLSVMKNTLKLERPWISSVRRRSLTDQVIDSVTNKPIKRLKGVEWYFQNGGRSPATHMRINLVVKVGPPIPKTLDTPRTSLPVNNTCEKGELSGKFGDFTGVPGIADNSYEAPLESQDAPRAMDIIERNERGLWLVGCVDYSDITEKPWFRTDVLEYYSPQTDTWALWATGNSAR
jgi:hypothetical protein